MSVRDSSSAELLDDHYIMSVFFFFGEERSLCSVMYQFSEAKITFIRRKFFATVR
jgi:hypothetical protein